MNSLRALERTGLPDGEQALTLSFCTQWPVGPVDVKSYWPPKKIISPKFVY